VDTSADAPQTAGSAGTKSGRLLTIAMIAIFDVAAPLAAYSALRSAGWSAVAALLLSGVFPVLGVSIAAIRNGRLDVVGGLVLAGIVVGTVLGLAFHSARLLLIEGSVPTAVFGFVCLGSLWARRPLLFSVALEFTGPDTARGREMTSLWEFGEYRRILRIITAVWGIGFLVEAALRVVIVYNTSTGTALASSKVSPFVFAAVLSAWTVAYGTHQKRKGERRGNMSQIPAPGHVAPASPEVTKAPDLT
jgi:predicted lysophospholipase L1 biosynthesis ABC-type transport system permease subunit